MGVGICKLGVEIMGPTVTFHCHVDIEEQGELLNHQQETLLLPCTKLG